MASRLSSALIIGVATGLVGVAASLVPLGVRFEETAGLDWLFMLRGPRTPPDEVVVVSMGQQSGMVLGLARDPKSWPRGLHADVVRKLRAAGAAVVALDLFLDEPRGEADDDALAAAVGAAGNVVISARLRKDMVAPRPGAAGSPAAVRLQVVLPLEALRERALASAPFPLPVVPVKVSQFWAFSPATGNLATMPVTAFQAYAVADSAKLLAATAALRPGIGTRLLPSGSLSAPGATADFPRRFREELLADRALERELRARLDTGDSATTGAARLLSLYAGPDSYYLNYYGPPGTIPTIPYHRVLSDQQLRDGAGDPLDLRGKVVFVGLAEEVQAEQKDHFFFVYSGDDGLNISGAEIGATAVANLIENRLLQHIPVVSQIGTLLAFGLLLGVLCRLLPPVLSIGAALTSGALYLAGAHHAFGALNLWLPLMTPLFLQAPLALLLAIFMHYQQTRAQRERIQVALGRYVPARLVAQLAREGVNVNTGAEVVYGICLATDASQYTRMAETLTPEEVGHLLNDYYGLLFSEVDQRGGFVSDVVGDAMMAVWASARPDPALRLRACEAALGVRRVTTPGNASATGSLPPTRIGLHAGAIRLGNIGAGQHFEYRAVGDIVNTASRIEGLNKVLGTRILASAETVAGLDALRSRELGSFLLPGKSLPVLIHEVMGTADDAAPADTGEFAAALSSFRTGNWALAAEAFAALHRQMPADGPAGFYAELAARLAAGDAPAELLKAGAIRIDTK
jgi:adenylate cyclase